MAKLYTITVTLTVEVTDTDAPQQIAQERNAVADAVERHLSTTLPRSYTIGGYRFLTEAIHATGEQA